MWREAQYLAALSFLHQSQGKKCVLGFLGAQNNDIHIFCFSETWENI